MSKSHIPPIPGPWLSVDEVEARTQVTRRAIFAAINRRELQAVKLGGPIGPLGRRMYRIHVDAIEPWVNARRQQAKPRG